ncbi:GAF sensor signal transduction histidine kinase [Calothrix sp. NIES-4071]|nr:GAF sensor signal transduction histidine kinase [Calothrix sp. NIES-4071]BAZ61993.1 GAF sensor signal transduction histidine kinase [Calothrix sp. NIES-4105]
MLSSPDLGFSRTLRIDTFHQLGKLLEQMAYSVENTALVLTEAVLSRIPLSNEWLLKRFTVVVSQGFSALLTGMRQPDSGSAIQNNLTNNHIDDDYHLLDTSLTFDQGLISSFLLELSGLLGRHSETYRELERYSEQMVPNSVTCQEKFTLQLLECLLTQPEPIQPFSNDNSNFYACQHVEDALEKQIAQERLLNRVTTQIRKSLDLSVIMTTALAQVREFLELDRLVIYKFEQSKSNHRHLSIPNSSVSVAGAAIKHQFVEYGGCIVYEVRASDAISTVLNYTEQNCFTPTTECWSKYRQGFTLAVNDIYKTYTNETCLLNFLEDAQVRAKLVAPIMFENKLWGLLIAHQCYSVRNWNESEKNLLGAVAEQLAIAIHQAELMKSLTQEKQSLEQRVIERTMALHDALVAAEAASRIRSEFLATISHELLTPLTYVIGMSSTLLRWSFGELSQRQRDYLQTIHDSGEHLLEMINDILDLSQIEAGKAVLNNTEFSLTEVAELISNSLQEKAITQQVDLKLDLQVNANRHFCADARRVQQILNNLLSNAIKFTPEGGSVTLRLWCEDNNAVFQIEDTGIGIPEEQLPQLFEKFHQLDNPLRRRYGGTGLGLALTKQLVEMHRGRIEVESTVEVGSVFTVWIPEQPSK